MIKKLIIPLSVAAVAVTGLAAQASAASPSPVVTVRLTGANRVQHHLVNRAVATSVKSDVVWRGNSAFEVSSSGSTVTSLRINNTGCPTGTSAVAWLDGNGDGRWDSSYEVSPLAPWGWYSAPVKGAPSVYASRTEFGIQCNGFTQKTYQPR